MSFSANTWLNVPIPISKKGKYIISPESRPPIRVIDQADHTQLFSETFGSFAGQFVSPVLYRSISHPQSNSRIRLLWIGFILHVDLVLGNRQCIAWLSSHTVFITVMYMLTWWNTMTDWLIDWYTMDYIMRRICVDFCMNLARSLFLLLSLLKGVRKPFSKILWQIVTKQLQWRTNWITDSGPSSQKVRTGSFLMSTTLRRRLAKCYINTRLGSNTRNIYCALTSWPLANFLYYTKRKIKKQTNKDT